MYIYMYNFASAKSDLPPHNTLYNKESNDIWWHPLMPLYIIRVFFIDFMYKNGDIFLIKLLILLL